uniref:Ig-like domain-containing protein n=1 Tax=Xiphophorus maculatus TaxID=8083 RepID=A0A3B5QQA7_XIPMA
MLHGIINCLVFRLFVFLIMFLAVVSNRVSVTSQPNRSLIYRGEKVTLRCEIQDDGETEWTYEWKTTNRNFPSYSKYRIISATEADSGEYSCKGRRSDYHDGVILVSPVHPVTEGDPVTLSCRDKKQNLLSNVFFYHDNKLINNDSREELKISAVSKSDEGFYKCQHSGKESKRIFISSWISAISLCSHFCFLLVC